MTNEEAENLVILPNEDWEEAKKGAIHLAQLQEGSVSMPPTFIVYYVTMEGGVLSPIKVDVNSFLMEWVGDEKRAALKAMAAHWVKTQKFVVGLFMVAEAWVRQQKPDEPYVQPVDDPHSKEVLYASGIRLIQGNMEHWAWATDVTRDKDNLMHLADPGGKDQGIQFQCQLLENIYRQFLAYGAKMEPMPEVEPIRFEDVTDEIRGKQEGEEPPKDE